MQIEFFSNIFKFHNRLYAKQQIVAKQKGKKSRSKEEILFEFFKHKRILKLIICYGSKDDFVTTKTFQEPFPCEKKEQKITLKLFGDDGCHD